MGGMSQPDPADYGPMADASERSAELGYDLGMRQQDFAESQWDQISPYMTQALETDMENSRAMTDIARQQASAGAAAQQQYLGIMGNQVSGGLAAQNRGLDIAQQNADVQGEIAQTQIGSMEQQMEHAKDYFDYNKSTFRPLEKDLVAKAKEFSDAGYQEQKARQAMGRHQQQSAIAQESNERRQASMGVNPNSGRSAEMNRQTTLQDAASRTQIANSTREQAEAMGHARMVEAAGLGRNLPGASTNAYQAASQAGNVASGAANSAGTMGIGMANSANQANANSIRAASAGLSAGNSMVSAGMSGLQGATSGLNNSIGSFTSGMGQTMSGMNMGAGTAMQGQSQQIGGLGSIMNTQANMYNNYEDPMGAALGLGATVAGGMFSDRRLKESIELVGEYPNGLPMYEFSFIGHEGRYRGVMADEVYEVAPEAVLSTKSGYMAVRYDKLGIQMERVA